MKGDGRQQVWDRRREGLEEKKRHERREAEILQRRIRVKMHLLVFFFFLSLNVLLLSTE